MTEKNFYIMILIVYYIFITRIYEEQTTIVIFNALFVSGCMWILLLLFRMLPRNLRVVPPTDLEHFSKHGEMIC